MVNTHMGQPPSHHVILESFMSGGITDFKRIGPDGLPVGGHAFRVPVGQVLVVTDVDWFYGGGAPGGIQTFRIFLRPIADPGEDGSPVFESTVRLNITGAGGISESMTSGFVVSSAGFIHVEMDNPGGGTLSHVIIRGYLSEES